MGTESGAPATDAPQPASRRRAGRPPRAVLSPDRILKAALKLTTDSGYDGLTMAALARRLGVAPSALYNHVSSKQDVLVLIEDHLTTQVDVSGFSHLSWDDAVRAWARSYRDVFSKHTPLIPIIAVLPVTNAPRTLEMYEAVTAGFVRAGFAQERIIPAIVVLESFIFGSAYDATAPADIFDSGALAEATPHFTRAVSDAEAAQPGRAADTAFELGLDALVAGLSAHLPRT